MNTEATTELEELQDQARATVQLSQSERFTMGGHVRQKLRLGRERLKKTWLDRNQLPADMATEEEDEMQILARDITFTEQLPAPPVPPPPAAVTPPTPTPAPTPAAAPTSKWPMAVAMALGLGVPATTGILMAPTIIDAINGNPPAVQPHTEYAPILIPGKPLGAK